MPSKPPCSLCEAPSYCKGLCRKHYNAQRNTVAKKARREVGIALTDAQVEERFRPLVNEAVVAFSLDANLCAAFIHGARKMEATIARVEQRKLEKQAQ